MSDQPVDESQEVIIRDGITSDYELKVNSDGSLNIVDASSSLADQDKVFQIAETINITGGGTENNFLLIKNPSGSGKKLKIIDITIGFTNTVNVMATFKLYASPTITTNGTTLTVKPGRIGASTPTSSMQAYSAPTISARGSEYLNFMVTGGPSTPSSYCIDVDQSIIVDANYNILLTGTPDGTNRGVLITVRWIEV